MTGKCGAWGAVVQGDHGVAGEDPGQHPAVAGFGGGACRCGEPVPCVLLVAAVVLDDRDQCGEPGCGAHDGGPVACGVGAFQYVP